MTPTNDQEMRDLIIRLDEKVSNGFTNISLKLDAIERRAESHEARIHSLEIDNADRKASLPMLKNAVQNVDDHDRRLGRIETTAGNMKSGIMALWAVFGTAILAGIGKMVSLF